MLHYQDDHKCEDGITALKANRPLFRDDLIEGSLPYHFKGAANFSERHYMLLKAPVLFLTGNLQQSHDLWVA